jgi:selenocysteine-specific elongation factor
MADVFVSAKRQLLASVEAFHTSEPLLQGIGREELKARALAHGSGALFRAALDALVAEGVLGATGDLVHVAQRAVRLGGDEARTRERLAARYRALGLQAPPFDEIVRDEGLDRSSARKIVQLMIADRVLVKVAEDLFVHGEALDALVATVRGLKAQGGTFGVGEFKALTGLSRKFAMPLLEYLDGQRVTRRLGDTRVIL